MRKLRSAFVALSVLALAAGAAQGQRFGGQVDWGTDTDLGIGARLEYDLAGGLGGGNLLSRAYLIGSFDYFFPNCDGDGVDCGYFEFNGNVATPLDVASTLKPYVGAGLNMARASAKAAGVSTSDTQVGLNLLGGLKFAIGSLSSFAEARLELSGGEQFVITWGLLFGPNTQR